MKRIFSMVLLSLAPLLASAQWEFGVDLGASISRSNRADEPNFLMKNAISFLPEFRASYSFAPNWYLGFGAAHVTKCYRLEPTDEWEGETPSTCRFRYFTLPVLLTYRFPISDFWLGFSYGIQGDFFISQKTPTMFYNGEEHRRYELDNKEMNQCFGMSLGTEFGYNLNENWKLLLSYRCAFDLVNADERAFHGRFRSNTISLGFRYVLDGATLVESYDALSAVE